MAVMGAAGAGQVLIIKEVDLGDIFPLLGIVDGVAAVAEHARHVGGHGIIADTSVEGMDTEGQSLDSAGVYYVDQAPTENQVAMRVARVAHVENAVDDLLAVAHVGV